MRVFFGLFLFLSAFFLLNVSCTKESAPQVEIGSYTGLQRMDWQTVSRFLGEFNNVFIQRDLSFFDKHMSEDAQIEIEQNGKKAKVDKKKYMEVLGEAWKKIEDYQFSHTKPEIAIQGDAANAHMIVTEIGKVMGRSIESVSDTTIELALVDGKIMIRAVKGKSRMSMKKAKPEPKDSDPAKITESNGETHK